MFKKHFVGVALIYEPLVKGLKTFCRCCTHICAIGEMIKKHFVGVALINVSTLGGCCTHKCIR